MSKINLFDIFVALLIILIICSLAVYLIYPELPKSVLTQEAEWKSFNVEVISTSFHIVNKFKTGDKQIGSDGRVFAELISYDVKKYSDLLGDKFSGYVNNENVVLLKFKVLAKLWGKGPAHFGNSQLMPGEMFEFICDRYKLLGSIYTVSPP